MEHKRGRGRPPKVEWVTLDQALSILRDELMRRYKDETVVKELMICKKTLYNKINLKKLKRSGPYGCALVDRNEILLKFAC